LRIIFISRQLIADVIVDWIEVINSPLLAVWSYFTAGDLLFLSITTKQIGQALKW